jgi:hypothetical protein
MRTPARAQSPRRRGRRDPGAVLAWNVEETVDSARVVDELRDFDFELPLATPTIDFPDASSPEYAGWDRHDVYVDLERSWVDAAGVRWVNLLCSRKSGVLFVTVGVTRPLSERRPGERCLAPTRPRSSRRDARLVAFWPCFVDLERPKAAALG